MIVWDPALETGDETIDSQHRELFAIVGELHEACVEQGGAACIDRILDRLLGYTRKHFSDEQALMARHGYPPEDVMAHTTEHIALRRHVDDLLEQRRRGELDNPMPLAFFMHDWLRTHIRQSDRALVAFVKQA